MKKDNTMRTGKADTDLLMGTLSIKVSSEMIDMAIEYTKINYPEDGDMPNHSLILDELMEMAVKNYIGIRKQWEESESVIKDRLFCVVANALNGHRDDFVSAQERTSEDIH